MTRSSPYSPKVTFIDQKLLINISSLFHSQPIDRTADCIFRLCVLTADERIFRVGFLSNETLQRSSTSSPAKGESAPVDSIRQFFVDNIAGTAMTTVLRSRVEVHDTSLFYARTSTGDAERVRLDCAARIQADS